LARHIRPERSFESFSRGLELIAAIHQVWRKTEALARAHGGVLFGFNSIVNTLLDAVREEFDLTLDEWHYWAEIARESA
jgi:hypothetical protein